MELIVLSDRAIRLVNQLPLTYRLVLPSTIFDSISLLEGRPRIWWVERLSNRLYLKACLANCRIRVRHAKIGVPVCVVVGDLSDSAYVYKDMPYCVIDDLDKDLTLDSTRTVFEIDKERTEHLLTEIDRVTPTVITLRDAARINRRALCAVWPDRIVHPKHLYKTFKRYATLSDLVRVNGLDPFETSVAAAIAETRGRAPDVEETVRLIHGVDARPADSAEMAVPRSLPALVDVGSNTFETMFPLPTRLAVRPMQRNYMIDHQSIVAALAQKLKSMRLKPHFSQLVDLAVVDGKNAIFFEVKTSENGNLLKQARSGIGQLMEYGFRYHGVFDKIRLVLVTPRAASTAMSTFLNDFSKHCGVQWIGWDSQRSHFEYLDQALA